MESYDIQGEKGRETYGADERQASESKATGQ